MTPPPDAVIAKVREWVAVADEDIRVARHTLSISSNCPYTDFSLLKPNAAPQPRQQP